MDRGVGLMPARTLLVPELRGQRETWDAKREPDHHVVDGHRAGRIQRRKEILRPWLKAFYRKYNPEKILDMERILTAYVRAMPST